QMPCVRGERTRCGKSPAGSATRIHGEKSGFPSGPQGRRERTIMRRFAMNAVLLGGLALMLPACGSSNSDPAVVDVDPNPGPDPTPDNPGIETFPNEGSAHVPVGSVVVYLTDPPTSGNHYPF